MHISSPGKVSRGSVSVISQQATAVKATDVTLSKHMSIEQIFQCIATNCLTHMQANENGVAREYGMESLHQMRVALRRLDSALGLFKGLLKLTADLRVEFEWLSAQLSAARDWDVLFCSTFPKLAGARRQVSDLADIRRAVQDKVHEMHDAASAAVRSPRYIRLVLRFSCWLQERCWRDGMSLQDIRSLSAKDKAQRFVHKKLAHEQHRLRCRGRKINTKNPQVRHRVRIAAKKARYAAEFFQSLYPSATVRPYLKALSLLQDELGWLNDVAVAGRLLKELPDDQNHTVSIADIAYIRGYLAGIAGSDKRKILKLWKKFESVKMPG